MSVSIRAITSVFLILKEYTPDLFVPSSGIKCERLLVLDRDRNDELGCSLFNHAPAELSLSHRRAKAPGLSFLNILLRGVVRGAKLAKNCLETLDGPKRCAVLSGLWGCAPFKELL